MQWTSRVVIDTRGADEDTAYADYEAEAEHLTATTLTAEARGLSVEFDSEWSAERSAEAIYEYMRDRGEPVTMSRTAVSLGAASLTLGDEAWWRCGDDGEGWITDEADVEIAADYLRAAAHDEN